MSTNKSPEGYRRLAAKCRERARTVSAENGCAELLAMAEIWELIASRGDARNGALRGDERPAVIKTGKWQSRTASV